MLVFAATGWIIWYRWPLPSLGAEQAAATVSTACPVFPARNPQSSPTLPKGVWAFPDYSCDEECGSQPFDRRGKPWDVRDV